MNAKIIFIMCFVCIIFSSPCFAKTGDVTKQEKTTSQQGGDRVQKETSVTKDINKDTSIGLRSTDTNTKPSGPANNPGTQRGSSTDTHRGVFIEKRF